MHPSGRESTIWRYVFTATDSGTEVAETYEFLWRPITSRAFERFIPRDRQLRRGIQQTLERRRGCRDCPRELSLAMTSYLGERWEQAYAQGDTGRSWFQEEATASLVMFDEVSVSPAASVIDVGGGASTLVDGLLHRGFDDVSVLDISARGLEAAQTATR